MSHVLVFVLGLIVFLAIVLFYVLVRTLVFAFVVMCRPRRGLRRPAPVIRIVLFFGILLSTGTVVIAATLSLMSLCPHSFK